MRLIDKKGEEQKASSAKEEEKKQAVHLARDPQNAIICRSSICQHAVRQLSVAIVSGQCTKTYDGVIPLIRHLRFDRHRPLS